MCYRDGVVSGLATPPQNDGVEVLGDDLAIAHFAQNALCSAPITSMTSGRASE